MHCHRNSRARGRSEGRTWPNPISGSSEQNCFLKFRHRSEILNPLCAVSLFLIHQQYIPRIAIWTAQNSLEFSCAFNGDVRHNQVRLFAHWARNHGRRINRQKFPGSNPLFVMSGSLMVAARSHGRRSLPLHFLCRGKFSRYTASSSTKIQAIQFMEHSLVEFRTTESEGGLLCRPSLYSVRSRGGTSLPHFNPTSGGTAARRWSSRSASVPRARRRRNAGRRARRP